MEQDLQEGRLSPFQPENSHLYYGDTPYTKAVLNFCLQPVGKLPQLAEVSNKFSVDEMATPPWQTQILKLLIQSAHCRQILEIGTFIGYTTLSLAEALPENGMITTIEIGEEFAQIAQRNFSANPLGQKIKLIHGDAFQVLPNLKKESYDLVYMDGAKQLYPDLFQLSAPLVKKGGLFVADDVFFHGDAINDHPQTDKGTGAKRFVHQIVNDPSWVTSILPISNGLLIACYNP